MKKLLFVSLIMGLVFAPTANAATKISLYPQYKVDHKKSVITIKLTGLPTDHGIYLQQCMAPKKNSAPTSCNPAEASKLWVSNVPADIAQGAISGKSKIDMHVDAYFKKGDCIHTTCVIAATNDHNASSDRSEDQVVPFKFS